MPILLHASFCTHFTYKSYLRFYTYRKKIFCQRFQNLLGLSLKYVGRDELCQPAVGVGQVHQAENRSILERTFA